MSKLQVVHNQLNKASLCFFLKHTHSRDTHTERGIERERSSLDAEREREKERRLKKTVFSTMLKKGRKKRVSFAVKTFVVELNIWMPQAK